jgi:hypothetical protein
MAPYKLTIWDVAYDPHPNMVTSSRFPSDRVHIYPLAGSVNYATCYTCSQSLSRRTHSESVKKSKSTQSVSFSYRDCNRAIVATVRRTYGSPRQRIPYSIFAICTSSCSKFSADDVGKHVPQSHARAMRQAIPGILISNN